MARICDSCTSVLTPYLLPGGDDEELHCAVCFRHYLGTECINEDLVQTMNDLVHLPRIPGIRPQPALIFDKHSRKWVKLEADIEKPYTDLDFIHSCFLYVCNELVRLHANSRLAEDAQQRQLLIMEVALTLVQTYKTCMILTTADPFSPERLYYSTRTSDHGISNYPDPFNPNSQLGQLDQLEVSPAFTEDPPNYLRRARSITAAIVLHGEQYRAYRTVLQLVTAHQLAQWESAPRSNLETKILYSLFAYILQAFESVVEVWVQ